MTSQITITSEGITVPQTSEVKTAFQGVFTNAFGTDLSLDDSTPQGSMIDDFTIMKQESNTNDLKLFNQFNPETAEGIFQDALGAIYGMKRIPAKHSVVTCQCIGVQGTVIDENAIAQNVNGDLFKAIETKTIPASGTVNVQFESIETGAIPCGANTVNKVYSIITGWDAINNSSAGAEGQEAESRADFEERRKKELGRNATGSLSAVYSRLSEVDGVADVFVWENDTNTNVTYRGVTLTPHSIFVCINGGLGQDIAEAIYNSKSAGCDTTATGTSITCTYTDPMTSVNYTYNIQRPTNVPIMVKVGVSASISDDIKAQIKEAIINDWKGYTNESSITIGTSIYASRFYADIVSLGINDLQLVNVKVSDDSGTTYGDVLTFDIDELPTIEENDIVFEVI